jgi:hypothetical protein
MSTTTRPAIQGADTATMRSLILPGDEYVDHRKPVCVEPYLYVQPVIVRKGRPGRGEFTVWFVWTDTRKPLDRRLSHGISTGTNRDLAYRLSTATACGRIQSDPEVLTDVEGHTYVGSRCAVMGRYLNADLKRMGF